MRRGHSSLLIGFAGDTVSEDARPNELEQLLRLGSALEVGMDSEACQRTLAEHLQPLIGRRAVRLTVDTGDWRQSDGAACVRASATDQRRRSSAWDTFPLVAGNAVVGALEVAPVVDGQPQPLSGWQRRLLEMASPLVGRAVKNAQLFRQAQQLSAVDALTGCLANRSGLELVRLELRRAQRYGRPPALAFIDLDHFKQVNDRYGHLFGDAVLRVVGAALRAALRGSDLCCRYGGDEFLVLLPETPLAGARHVAEMLRRRLVGITMERPDGPVTVTASIGVAAAGPGELDAGNLLVRADTAMYQAKRAGGNVVSAGEGDPERQ